MAIGYFYKGNILTKYNYHLNDFTPYHGRSVFVFGSNEAGIHGKGAAKYAKENLGAEIGVGFGFTGRCFALPTKNKRIQSLPIDIIELYVHSFLRESEFYDDLVFFVTRIGCGLAGYTDAEIAPLFVGAPENCMFPIEWKEYLE